MKPSAKNILLIIISLIILLPLAFFCFFRFQQYLQEKKSKNIVREIKTRLERKYNVVDARGYCSDHFPDGSPSCEYAFIYYNRGEGPTIEDGVTHYDSNSMQIHLYTEINESYDETLKKLSSKLPEGI